KRHGRETRNHRSGRRTVVSNGEEIGGVVALGVVVAESVDRDQDYIRTRSRLGIGESGGDCEEEEKRAPRYFHSEGHGITSSERLRETIPRESRPQGSNKISEGGRHARSPNDRDIILIRGAWMRDVI